MVTYNQGIDVMHVHSGETHFYSTTKPEKIKTWVNNSTKHIIIFTTYHSLKRVVESDITIDTAYFDEAHNSVTRSFSPPTESVSYHSAILLVLVIAILGNEQYTHIWKYYL